MKIENQGRHFVIRRGQQFFSFFGDSDSSSWTKIADRARQYPTSAQAEDNLAELRRRAKLLRAARPDLVRGTHGKG